MRGEPSLVTDRRYGNFSVRRRVGPQEGGYCTLGRDRRFLLIRRRLSHVQQQGFKDFGFKQRAQMVGGKVGIVVAKLS